MSETATKPPILTLNVQVNEFESERIEIFCLTELEDKTDRFCKVYHITDNALINKFKLRVKDALKAKYPFLFPNEKKKKALNPKTKKKLPSERDIPVTSKFKSRTTLVDSSVSKVGIQSLLYNNKKDTNLYQNSNLKNRKANKLVKSFADTTKARKFTSKKPAEDKENKIKSKNETKDVPKGKTQLDLNLSLSTVMNKEGGVCSVYNFNNPLLTYSYTNPNVMQNKPIPKTTTNKSFLGKIGESDFNYDNNRYMSSYSNAKMAKKSSFYEQSNHHDKRKSSIYDSQVQLKETRATYNIINDANESVNNFDNYVFKLIPMEKLKDIFDKLDSDRSGLIGPKNLNLRSLSAEHLKMLENVIIEIFKVDQNTYFTFQDFCQLVKDLTKME